VGFAILPPVNRRRLLVGGVLAVLAIAVALGVYAYLDDPEPPEKRGSARQEFLTTEAPAPKPKPRDPTPWPTYSYDNQRTHVSPYRHRPPYRRLWSIDARDTVEFPGSIGYGRAYVAQQKGLFFALNAKTGKVAWRKNTGRCHAASPTLGKGLVYQAVMDHVPCPPERPGATGYVVAWDADTGRRRWQWNNTPVESSPLLVGNRLFVGTWDHGVYALNARNGKVIWRFAADEQVNTAGAYWRGTVYIASNAGTLFAVDARTGRERWRARAGSGEFFYATPTVAYGRVFIGNTDGTMYVYGARTGRLLWARPLGSYVYGAAAVWRRRVFVGTYDGYFYSLDAATGDVKWRITAPGAVHAAATVMRGLVYYATCSSCGAEAQRSVKRGPDGVYALNARNGRQVWRFPNGKYANPVVADDERIYVTGRSFFYSMEPRAARKKPRSERRRQRR
jgi:outer membrane protein assembly factor BamB